jgi:hypothetical protein
MLYANPAAMPAKCGAEVLRVMGTRTVEEHDGYRKDFGKTGDAAGCRFTEGA